MTVLFDIDKKIAEIKGGLNDTMHRRRHLKEAFEAGVERGRELEKEDQEKKKNVIK